MHSRRISGWALALMASLSWGLAQAAPSEQPPELPPNARPLPEGAQQPAFVRQDFTAPRSAAQQVCDAVRLDCAAPCDASLIASPQRRDAHRVCIKRCALAREACERAAP